MTSGPMALMIFNELPYIAEAKYVMSQDCSDVNNEDQCQALTNSEFKMGVNTLERIIGDWHQECLSVTNISLSPDAKLGLSLFSLSPNNQAPNIDDHPEFLGSNIDLNQLESRAMTLSGRYYHLELWAPDIVTDFLVTTDKGSTLYSVRATSNNSSDNHISTNKNYHILLIEHSQFLQIINASITPTQDSYFRLTDINCGSGCTPKTANSN